MDILTKIFMRMLEKTFKKNDKIRIYIYILKLFYKYN